MTDWVIQQAISQMLTPVSDLEFSESSFGFRPRRSGQQAVQQVHRLIKAGNRFAVDVDLSKFFARVNRDRLKELKLKINESKSRVVKSSECEFLGFSFRCGYINWSEKTLERFKDRV
ncbi:hypothetical protein AB833_30845 [Chromatiales bacterium (ex Bugula neritina AB1)]|nr:hypothetical protein AB833_30845 [Chromatiales bacterium (ex Bugula neritina AB1)]